MGQIDKVFIGAIIVVGVLALAASILNSAGPGPGPRGVTDEFMFNPARGTVDLQFTGNATEDICTCFQQAYSLGRMDPSIETVQYEGGYSICTNRLGFEGSRAWTQGWSSAKTLQGPRNCQGYFRWVQDRRVGR